MTDEVLLGVTCVCGDLGMHPLFALLKQEVPQ